MFTQNTSLGEYNGPELNSLATKVRATRTASISQFLSVISRSSSARWPSGALKKFLRIVHPSFAIQSVRR